MTAILIAIVLIALARFAIIAAIRKRLSKEEWEKAPRASKKYYELLNKEK